MSLKDNFAGKRVLVTGAGRGIGKAIVARLHNYGATVFALSKNPQNLEIVKQEFPNILTIAVNLEDWNATREAVESIGHVDFLVNNAGVLPYQEFFDILPETFDMQFAINLKSVINVSQVIGKKMVQAGSGGSIVNISSTGGRRQGIGGSVYSSTKAALESLTRSMAVELGKHKIRVNAICPGFVETHMLTNYFEQCGTTIMEASNVWDTKLPLGKCCVDMEALVNSILFILCDLSSMTTGERLAVDGGFLCV